MKRKLSKRLLYVFITLLTCCVSVAATLNENNSSSDKHRKFVKTKYKCGKCSCSGYWGYKHHNGTYEGNCSNSDGHGHSCGHGPEKHGLKKW